MPNIERYEEENWLHLPADWKEWNDLQKVIHIIHREGQNGRKSVNNASTVVNPSAPSAGRSSDGTDQLR